MQTRGRPVSLSENVAFQVQPLGRMWAIYRLVMRDQKGWQIVSCHRTAADAACVAAYLGQDQAPPGDVPGPWRSSSVS